MSDEIAIPTDEGGEELVWTTKDGTRFPISKMRTSHLRNAKRWVQSLDVPYPAVQGEQAQYDADQMTTEAENFKLRWVAAFDQELRRRAWLERGSH